MKSKSSEGKGIKRKPEDWLKTLEFQGYTILDPDGWDRKNWKQSWNEKITKQEMVNRLMKSTLLRNPEIIEEYKLNHPTHH